MNQLENITDYPILHSDLVVGAEGQFELNVPQGVIGIRIALDQLTAARSKGARAEASAYHSLRDKPVAAGPSQTERAFAVRGAEAFGLINYLAPGPRDNMEPARPSPARRGAGQ